MEIEKLVKVMGLTTSSHDGEALNAIRIANGILEANNISWEQFISQKTFIIQEIQAQAQGQTQAQAQGQDNIQRMLDVCLQRVTSASGQSYIRSLNEWYAKKGFLTPKQEQGLKNWYNNL